MNIGLRKNARPALEAGQGGPSEDPGLARLRERIRRLERRGGGNVRAARPAVRSLGAAPIDALLPDGGLTADALHEILDGDGETGAAAGFAAALAARFAGADGLVLWCRRRRRQRRLYLHGLAAFGLDPRRLVVVAVGDETDLLWAMEEGLRSGAVAAVVGEAATQDSTALRRLQLAAEAGPAPALLLRAAGVRPAPAIATTRWKVTPLTGDGAARAPRWHVALERCRHGRTGAWPIGWRDGAFVAEASLPHTDAAPERLPVARPD